jgi:nicotinamide mononucleotide transporter
MALWGIYLWQCKKEKEELPISYVGVKWNIISIFAGFGLALLLGYFSSFFLEANMRYLDSVTTLFAIIATFMLVLRKVDNWIYFIFVDAAYIYIYTKAGSPFLAGVMIIYTLMAIYGYYSWHQKFIFSINSDR